MDVYPPHNSQWYCKIWDGSLFLSWHVVVGKKDVYDGNVIWKMAETITRVHVAGIQTIKAFWKGMLGENYWTWNWPYKKDRTWTSREVWVQWTLHAEGMVKGKELMSRYSQNKTGEITVPMTYVSNGKWISKGVWINMISLDSLEKMFTLKDDEVSVVWDSQHLGHKPCKKSRFLWTLESSTVMIHYNKVFLFFFSLERTHTLSILSEVQGNQSQYCDIDSPPLVNGKLESHDSWWAGKWGSFVLFLCKL